MNLSLNHKKQIDKKESIAYLFDSVSDLANLINKEEENYLNAELKLDSNFITLSYLGTKRIFFKTPEEEDSFKYSEKIRVYGFDLFGQLNNGNDKTIQIKNLGTDKHNSLLLAEGLALSFYKFDKYKSDKKTESLKIEIVSESLDSNTVEELENVVNSTYIARDLVNEPQSYLNTIQYSKDLDKFCNEFGIKYSKFDKEKIVKLKMGGLLAVNQGSVTPPIFNILEYKPSNAVNTKPLVLVGKGVVYDTGGLSLKPTANSMDIMKCDMGGSAAVAGGIFAIAQNKLPVHVIVLIAATDNRPGGDAYAPGDVITMYNVKTVEVLNTDAEGRLTLGDALTYADELNPELVIDFATLTGAAARAIGKEASVVMGNAPAEVMMMLQESGMKTHERLVEFPLYDEYKEDIKSDIADMKNLGGAEAGATTAGLFLENYTTSPWIHVDIAGTAYVMGTDKYRGKHGTGVGVRLIHQFVKDYYNV